MILQHPYILQPPISNLCLKGSLDNNADTQFFPKWLLHLSVRELNNSIVILPEEDRLKEARILLPYTRLFVVASIEYIPKLFIITC